MVGLDDLIHVEIVQTQSSSLLFFILSHFDSHCPVYFYWLAHMFGVACLLTAYVFVFYFHFWLTQILYERHTTESVFFWLSMWWDRLLFLTTIYLVQVFDFQTYVRPWWAYPCQNPKPNLRSCNGSLVIQNVILVWFQFKDGFSEEGMFWRGWSQHQSIKCDFFQGIH